MIMYIHISYHVDYNPSGNLFIYIIIPVFNIAAILLLVVGQNTRDDDSIAIGGLPAGPAYSVPSH